MSQVPADLRYTKSHEWVRVDQDGSVVVGITDHAQSALGELVYVETPETSTQVNAGDACAVVESVKAASDIYAPIGGTVTDVNATLADQPELVNEQPYDDGWIMRIEPSDISEVDGLLDSETYEQSLEED